MKVSFVLILSASSLSNAFAQQWTQCIGDEIAQCASCVFETSAHALETVISAAEPEDAPETVGDLLETLNTAVHCGASICAKASTKLLAQQCGSMWCKTDFCVMCCGAGDWQCMGNDWKPLCAPAKEGLSARFIKNVVKKAKGAATSLVKSAAEKIEELSETMMEMVDTKAVEISSTKPEVNATGTGIAKCQCGPGSGNPSSCCSACTGGSVHDRSNCPGHGQNTGAFCGNDFHAAACYGDTPVCCTNDMGVPACCKVGQRCHSPLVGSNGCIDADETLVV